jgi:hypothetical protein
MAVSRVARRRVPVMALADRIRKKTCLTVAETLLKSAIYVYLYVFVPVPDRMHRVWVST